MAVISSSVTQGSSLPDKASPAALMLGYRAVYETCLGVMIVVCVIGSLGLRKVGRLGLSKED